MKEDKFLPIVSSNIEAASYDDLLLKMIVRFKNGTAYLYMPVSSDEWSQFSELFDGKGVISAGKWFAEHKSTWGYRRIENWKD